MKLYVHYEDRADAPSAPPRQWTKRVALTDALVTLDDVLRVFCAAYARKFAAAGGDNAGKGRAVEPLTPADIDVLTERGQESATRKRFEDDKRAQRWFAQRRERPGVDEECDFELVVVRKAARKSESRGGVRSPPSEREQRQNRKSSAKAVVEAPPQLQQHLQALLELGASQMQQLKYRSAKQLYETLVLSVDPSNAHALIAIGDIHAANQRFGVAVDDWYKKCWDMHLSKPRQDREQAWIVFECGLKIVKCEIQRQRYEEALEMIEKLQQTIRQQPKLSRESDSSGAFLSHSGTEKEAMEAKVDFLKAQALYEMHAASPELQDPAIALLTHLLPDLQDSRVDLDALLLYAAIAFDRGKKSEALSMALRVLVGRPEDKLVKKQLASFLRSSGDVKMLEQMLPPGGGASSAAAYAFIGTLLKDFGALESSVACFERALVGNPASPGYALNHAHVLEACDRYEHAYDVLTSFFKQNASSCVDGTLTAGAILNALDGEGDGGWLPVSDQHSGLPSRTDEGTSRTSEQWRVEWNADDFGHARVYLNDRLTNASIDELEQSPRVLEQDELDLLACFFALVKILFLTGRVSALPRLISLVEPVRAGRELHRTAIRNEHAYYSCIAQLLSVQDRFQPLPASEPWCQTPAATIYVCGDSHTLATSWREIRVHGRSTLLRPALVTGLKHWHLRKESVFYPKAHFWRVLGGIPPRSRVVFLFGEIDCREGILLAVEKCKYESIEEGMDATIRIFMEALGEAVSKHEFEAFIHPVVPVLNETRQLVIQYNKIFQKHVAKSSICKWLDFFGDLVHDSPEKLRAEFVLDGTHLHPRYLSSLERALDQHLQRV